MTKILTAEYVTAGHPDKMCDRISDAVLDAFYQQDETSRVAVETLGGHGKVYIMGEVTSTGVIEQEQYEKIVADIIGDDLFDVTIHITQQSPEIAQGVDAGGAGDQGIVVGYACNENEEMIPQEFYLAKSLGLHLYEKYPYDGKTQISINENFEVTVIVASFQNAPTKELTGHVSNWIEKNKVKLADGIAYLINPAGEWSMGGFDADTGVTGRKIVVDSYGPRVPVGGGAFSGKDWTKVDRSGAAYAKHIAQEILKREGANEVRVELAYAIGISHAVGAVAYIDNVAHEVEGFDTGMEGIKAFMDSRE